MEQITRKDGIIHYGNIPCRSADEAYSMFRKDYHDELGKRVYRRLNMRARTERLHGYKSYYTEERSEYLQKRFSDYPKVKGWLMGIVGISYCHAIGSWYMPQMDEDTTWDFIDYLLDVKSNALIITGRKNKTGRTGKSRKRYR